MNSRLHYESAVPLFIFSIVSNGMLSRLVLNDSPTASDLASDYFLSSLHESSASLYLPDKPGMHLMTPIKTINNDINSVIVSHCDTNNINNNIWVVELTAVPKRRRSFLIKHLNLNSMTSIVWDLFFFFLNQRASFVWSTWATSESRGPTIIHTNFALI